MSYIMQIVSIRLIPSWKSILSAKDVAEIEDWLSSWTCVNNFECCIESSYEDALNHWSLFLTK